MRLGDTDDRTSRACSIVTATLYTPVYLIRSTVGWVTGAGSNKSAVAGQRLQSHIDHQDSRLKNLRDGAERHRSLATQAHARQDISSAKQVRFSQQSYLAVGRHTPTRAGVSLLQTEAGDNRKPRKTEQCNARAKHGCGAGHRDNGNGKGPKSNAEGMPRAFFSHLPPGAVISLRRAVHKR
jgi:hypothetical protein